MKYLIILLLISVNAFGQTSDSMIREMEKEFAERKTDSFVYAPLPGGGIYLKDEYICKIVGFNAGINHSHKWVELHQDTVVQNPDPTAKEEDPYGPFDVHKERYSNGELTYVGIVFREYVASIPLICLICREEKKKVIHYKREK